MIENIHVGDTIIEVEDKAGGTIEMSTDDGTRRISVLLTASEARNMANMLVYAAYALERRR